MSGDVSGDFPNAIKSIYSSQALSDAGTSAADLSAKLVAIIGAMPDGADKAKAERLAKNCKYVDCSALQRQLQRVNKCIKVKINNQLVCGHKTEQNGQRIYNTVYHFRKVFGVASRKRRHEHTLEEGFT